MYINAKHITPRQLIIINNRCVSRGKGKLLFVDQPKIAPHIAGPIARNKETAAWAMPFAVPSWLRVTVLFIAKPTAVSIQD